MNYPRNINTYSKLQYLAGLIQNCGVNSLRVLFYNPWEKQSKIKGYDCRVNLWEVPDAFHVLARAIDRRDMVINHVPTLVTFTCNQETSEVTAVVNDNVTAINYELTSN